MQKLSELTEQLASAVVLADPTDLPALAQVHEQLRVLGELAEELRPTDAPRAEALKQTAGVTAQLIERLILREVDDEIAALQMVGAAVGDLLSLIHTDEASPTLQTPPAPPLSAQQAPASEAKPVKKGKKKKNAKPAPEAVQASPVEPALPEQEPSAQEPTGWGEPMLPPASEQATLLPETQSPINPDDVPLVLEFITESQSHVESAEAAVLQLEENPGDQEALSAIFRGFHTIKGVAGFLNLRQIGSLAHAAESLLDLCRHGKLQLEGAAVDVVLESIDLLKAMLASLDSAVKNNTAPAEPQKLPALLERLRQAAEGTLPQKALAAPAEAATARAEEESAAKPLEAKGASSGGTAAGEASVKVSTSRLDSLINMVGELVIAQSMVSQDVVKLAGSNQRVARNMVQLGKITRELQDLSMSMRMVPIQGVFQKMARLVRDLGRKAMKEIDFVVIGGETELDRNVVEAISDPLVHMVRNSVDHGIEPPGEREKAGKPRAGRVELKAYHQAGNIVIEIRDDGRGLNKSRILRKAIDAGIIRPDQQLSEQEIHNLIFHAGLSTAEKLTDVSGRGVGMDVVKRNVESLRGRIDIASTEGQGSLFTIRLPLTLAMIDGQIMRVGQEKYIVPITSIEQSIQPKASQLSTVQGRGEMCMVRGELLPMFRLYRLFGVKPQAEDPTKALLVIVHDGQKRCGLLVDELLGQQQVVIKSLGEQLGHVAGISGGAILGDGNVSLILDVPGLIQMASGK